MIKLKRYTQGIRIGSLAALFLLSSAYATANDGPNLKGHWVDETERCVAEAAGLAYATPKRNGIYTTVCSGKSVLAFRGTDMQGNDVLADIDGFLGGNYQMALDQVSWNGVDKRRSWDICTGHSLGGGIAKRFAHNYPARCGKIITFGAPAIQTKPKKEKVKEYINYLRGSKICDYCDAASCGPDAYRRFKDIVPTVVAGGHQNIKRLKNWPSHGIPKVIIGAHSMYHYYNKMLGDCPSIDMVQRTPFLERLTKWYIGEEFDLSQDRQACWIKSRQGTLFPVKRFVCTAGNDHGKPNCADKKVITHDYANEDTFKKGESVFPVNQCTSSWSGKT
ncbi:MAG: hypothetical protein HRU08_11405, partial [Oleispira sp.]|nr:hypothetical protein [Oleispira sp.]